MYPFRAIIVGGSEAERTILRREVTNLSVAIDHEYEDIEKVFLERARISEASCFFLIKVNSSANLEQLAQLSQFFPGKPIIALLNEDSDLSAVLNIQRAGAAQVILLPFQQEHLQSALDTVSRQFGRPTTSAKVIAVLGATEGCGATSLSMNLCDAISSVHNQGCILVELSLRISRLGFYLDIEPTVTVTDLLFGEKALEVNAVFQALVRVKDRYQVLAASHRAVDRRAIAPGRVVPLIGTLRKMAEIVVLDLPYTYDEMYFEALSIADHVVMIARPNPPSILALKVISEAVALKALGATQHLVIDCYGPRADELTESQLRTALATERIWTIAYDRKSYEAAVNSGHLLHQEVPDSRTWPEIVALAGQLIGLGEPAPVQKRAISWPKWVIDLFRSGAPVFSLILAAYRIEG